MEQAINALYKAIREAERVAYEKHLDANLIMVSNKLGISHDMLGNTMMLGFHLLPISEKTMPLGADICILHSPAYPPRGKTKEQCEIDKLNLQVSELTKQLEGIKSIVDGKVFEILEKG